MQAQPTIVPPDRARRTQSVARLSVCSNASLTVLKLVVGLMTGAVSVLAEAAHSANDLVASIVAFVAVRKANAPADETHPYGHGKFESLSGFLEALLIFGAATWIIVAATRRILHGGGPESVGPGMVVMGLSAGVNLFVARRLLATAAEHDSIALEADGWHLLGDVYTSVAVFVGLGVVHVFDAPIADPIAAIAVGLVILHAAYRLTHTSASQLLDGSVDPAIAACIADVVALHNEHFVETHKLRTRKAGSEIHVDLHMVVCKWLPTGQAHDLATHVENEIRERFPRCQVMIHIEGASGDCPARHDSTACVQSGIGLGTLARSTHAEDQERKAEVQRKADDVIECRDEGP